MSISVALIQAKPRKGDLNGNFERLGATFKELLAGGVPDLIVLPEASMTGYFL